MTSRYALVAGGAPSTVSGLTEHLAHQTLTSEQQTLAAYYQHGGAAEQQIGVLRPDMDPLVRRGLGLDGGEALTNQQIDGLMSGHRADGERIAGKTYSVRGGVPNHTGSIVFSPSPHKSVSVAWGLAAPVEQAMIYNAHLTASRDYMAFVESELGRIRIGKNGEDGRVQGHIGWIEFTHHTSRRTATVVKDGGVHFEKAEAAGDMDLHTHFVVPATAWTDDGRVGSLDTKCLSGDFVLAADGVYHAALARELRAAGLAVELDETRGPVGAARLTSVPQDICDVFSKRTNAGEALARLTAIERGENWDKLTAEQVATRVHNATQDRRQKSLGGKDDVADVPDWQRQCKDVGWAIPQSFRAVEQAVELTHEQRIRQAYEIALPGLDQQFQQRSVISAWDLRRAALAGLTASGYRDLSDVDAVVGLMRTEGVLHDGNRTRLIEGQEPDRRYQSVTTTLHEAQEREFVSLAKSAAADRSMAATPEQIDRAARESGLDFSDEHGKAQLRAVHMLGEGGAYGVLIGRDGAGKSTMLKVMTTVWAEQGREVYGASLAWEQAEAMTDGGIDKKNVQAFSVLLDALNDGRAKLGRRDVVAVDELGQIGTRQMLDLLRHRDRMGFSIVGLGDNRQCSAIEAGEIISLSRRALGVEQVPEILTTVRQHSEREREIVTHFRENRPERAIAMKREDGSAHMVMGGHPATVAAVAARYKEKLLETGTVPLVLTDTNADAHALSAAIRSERRGLGLIGPDIVTIKATDGDKQRVLGIAKGDHVRLYKTVGCTLANGRGGRIGRNRSVAEVLDADTQGATIKLTKDGTVGRVRWSDMADDAGNVRLAWAGALTAYSGQGKTADHVIEAYPSGSATSDGRNSFVKESRHRVSSEIIVNGMAERMAVKQSRPINDVREVTEDDRWAQFAKRLTASAPKSLATAMLDRSQGLQRGAVKDFHQRMHPAEQRMQQGLSPSAAPDRMQGERAAKLSPLQQVAELAHKVRDYVRDVAHELARHIRQEQAQRHQQQHERERQHQHHGPSMGMER